MPYVISTGKDKLLMVWKLTTGEIMTKLETNQLGDIYSGIMMKNTLITTSLDHTIALYDCETKSIF